MKIFLLSHFSGDEYTNSFVEHRRVRFADIEQNEGKNLQNREKSQDPITIEEEDKKNEIRDGIKKALQEPNEETKKKNIKELKDKYGQRVEKILEEDKEAGYWITEDVKTHDSVMNILEEKEKTEETSFLEFVKDAYIKDFSEIPKEKLSAFLAIPLPKALQLLEKNPEYKKKYLSFLKTLSSENKEVQKWVLSYTEKFTGEETAYVKLPVEAKEHFIRLHQEMLGKKGNKLIEAIEKHTKDDVQSIAEITKANASSEVQTEDELLQKIRQHFNDPVLLKTLKGISLRNNTENEKSLQSDMIDEVVKYVLQKQKENTEYTEAGIKALQRDYEALHQIIFETVGTVASSKKIEHLRIQLKETQENIQKLQEGLQNGFSKTGFLPNDSDDYKDAKKIDTFLQSFDSLSKKSFGETMINMRRAYEASIVEINAEKKQYRRTKNISSCLQNLQAKGISVDPQNLRAHFENQKQGDIPLEWITSLFALLPPERRNIDLKIYAPYIKNPLQHTEKIDPKMLAGILNAEPSAGLTYLYSKNNNIIATEAIVDHLEQSTSSLVNQLQYELQGKNSKEVIMEALERFSNPEFFENIYKKLSLIFNEIENTIKTNLEKNPTLKANMLWEFGQKKTKIPMLPLDRIDWKQGASQFLLEMQDFLKSENPKNAEDIIQIMNQSADVLEDRMLMPWQKKLFEVKKYSQDPETWQKKLDADVYAEKNPSSAYNSLHAESQSVEIHEKHFKALQEAFLIASRGEGFSLNGTLALQNLLNQKTKTGTPLIIPRNFNNSEEKVILMNQESASYNRTTGQIEISHDLYNALKNFKNNEAPYNLTEKGLGALWHEVGHLLVDSISHANQISDQKNISELVPSFADMVKGKMGAEKYAQLIAKATPLITGDPAFAEEELCIMLWEFLQISPEKRATTQYAENSLGRIVQEIFRNVGEKSIRDFFMTKVQQLIMENAKTMPQYFTYPKKEQRLYNQNTGEILNTSSQEEGNATKNASPEIKMGKADRDKKLEEYNNKVADLKKKITDIEKIIKETQNLPNNMVEKIQKTIKDCNAIMAYGRQKIATENLTAEQATSIIIQLSNRQPIDENGDKKVEKKDSTSVEGVLNGILKAMSDFPIDERSGVQKFWNNVEFLALDDLKAPWKTLKDYIKQRWRDQQSLRTNKVFSSIVPKWGWLTGLENEFSNAEEGSRSKIVKKYADGIANEENSYISTIFLPNVTNPEALLAAVKHLCKGGNMKWVESAGKAVAQKLQEFGSGVKFYNSDFKDELVMRLKFKKAFYRVYGKETLYDKLYTENKAANEGSVEKGIDQVSKLTYSGSDQIRDWIRQKCIYKKEPKEFYVKGQILEGFIIGNYLDGNFDNPNEVIFYMIMGIAQGIIGADAWGRAWGKVGSNPLFNILNGFSGDKEKMIEWQKEILWDEQMQDFRKPWDPPPPWFDAWVDNTLVANTVTATRVMKTGAQTVNYDHDNTYLILSHSYAEGADRVLQSGYGGQEQPTRFNNIPSGTMRVFTSFALNKKSNEKAPSEDFLRHMGYYSTIYGLGVLDNKEPDNPNIRRYTYGTEVLRQNPRGTGRGYNSDMKINDYFVAQNEMFLSMAKIPSQEQGFAAFLNLLYSPESRMLTSEQFGEELKRIYESSATFRESLEGMKTDFRGRNSYVFTSMVPAVFKYYLTPKGDTERKLYSKKSSELNYAVMMQTIDDISSGRYNPAWANQKDMRVVHPHSTAGYPPQRVPDVFMKKEKTALSWNKDGSMNKKDFTKAA